MTWEELKSSVRRLIDDRSDRDVRAAIARWIRDRGAIPLIAEIASDMSTDAKAVEASFVRMIDGHVFIPRRGSHEIYAYNPFCLGPTEFRVHADGRDWWAICGWDALGIPPALGVTGIVAAPCADGCGERIRIEVGKDGAAVADGQPVLHVGVPAHAFWDDIYLT